MIDLLLLLVPALALLCALLTGTYPGERAIATLAGGRRASARRAHRSAVSVRLPRPASLLPRGGRLVASAIAARPPPGWMRTPNHIHSHVSKES